MRFTYTKISQAEAEEGQQPPPPVKSIIAWDVDPLEIVAVGSLPNGRGCMLLCSGGHQVLIDGTWDIVVERVRAAKEGAQTIYAEAPPVAPVAAPQGRPVIGPAPIPTPPPQRARRDEPDPGVQMLSMHDGPAVVGD